MEREKKSFTVASSDKNFNKIDRMWSNSRTPKVCTKFWSSCVRHVQIWIMLPLPTRLARTSISVNKQKREKIENYSTDILEWDYECPHWMSGFFVALCIKKKKKIKSGQYHKVRMKIVEKLHLCGRIFLVFVFVSNFLFFVKFNELCRIDIKRNIWDSLKFFTCF